LKFNLAILSGDGIGPEVTKESLKILDAITIKFGHKFSLEEHDVGGVSIDKHGVAITEEALGKCLESNAVLFGAVGGPKWDDPNSDVRPEDGILKLRKELDLFANIRPAKVYKSLIDSSPLKKEILDGVDFIIIRELTSGLYFGEPKKRWVDGDKRVAVDTLTYTEDEIKRVVKVGFEMARKRKKQLHSLDKMNVMATSRLWREVTEEVSQDYKDVNLIHMLADNAAMQIITNPSVFDVIVTENTFGDILSDESAVIGGSMGMLPSASLSSIPGHNDNSKPALYEPIHGSAPDIAGKGIANPLASILSTAMMLRWSFNLLEEADIIENSVESIIDEGIRTKDLSSSGEKSKTTEEIGDIVYNRIIKS
jgi:3-isopropylmalate dehydrogenase